MLYIYIYGVWQAVQNKILTADQCATSLVRHAVGQTVHLNGSAVC